MRTDAQHAVYRGVALAHHDTKVVTLTKALFPNWHNAFNDLFKRYAEGIVSLIPQKRTHCTRIGFVYLDH